MSIRFKFEIETFEAPNGDEVLIFGAPELGCISVKLNSKHVLTNITLDQAEELANKLLRVVHILRDKPSDEHTVKSLDPLRIQDQATIDQMSLVIILDESSKDPAITFQQLRERCAARGVKL